jgi:hypothetical protein
VSDSLASVVEEMLVQCKEEHELAREEFPEEHDGTSPVACFYQNWAARLSAIRERLLKEANDSDYGDTAYVGIRLRAIAGEMKE